MDSSLFALSAVKIKATNQSTKKMYINYFFLFLGCLDFLFFKLFWLDGLFQKQPLDVFTKKVLLKSCTKLSEKSVMTESFQIFACLQPVYFYHRYFLRRLCSFSEQLIWRTYLRTAASVIWSI